MVTSTVKWRRTTPPKAKESAGARALPAGLKSARRALRSRTSDRFSLNGEGWRSPASPLRQVQACCLLDFGFAAGVGKLLE